MSSKSKQYNNLLKSKIEELYQGRREPKLYMFGKSMGINDVYEAIKQQPFIKTTSVKASVDPKNGNDEFSCLYTEKCSTDRGLINFIKELDFPEVKLVQSVMKKGSMFRPKFIIDLSKEEFPPHSKVRINTGYIVDIPNMAKIPICKGGQIVESNAISSQIPFVIVPQMKSEGDEIIPLISSRDADDHGYYCVSFYTKTGKVSKLTVVLHAFSCNKPSNGIKLIGGTAQDVALKPKDIADTRYTFNLKMKTRFDLGVAENSFVSFPTFNEKREIQKDKRIVIQNKTLFTSRKRECVTDNIVTLPGLYIPSKMFVCPIVYGEEFSVNLFGVTFINKPIVLFSKLIERNMAITYFNGSFFDVDNYKACTKSLKHLSECSSNLTKAFDQCKLIAFKLGVPSEQVVKLYDYHRCIDENIAKEYVGKDDKTLFDTKPHSSNPLSVNLFKAFVHLSKFSPIFTNEEKTTIHKLLEDGIVQVDWTNPKEEDIVTPTVMRQYDIEQDIKKCKTL